MKQKYSEKEVIEFLRESNAIEGVYDDESLKQAKIAWDYLDGEKELNTHVILRTHKILMLHQPGLYPNEKGYFRTIPVYIGGKEALPAAIVFERTKILAMNMWLHPKHWRAHHIEYEKIHPFVDGNGRTGRMFLNWERLRAGLPLLIITEGERFDYYKWFNGEREERRNHYIAYALGKNKGMVDEEVIAGTAGELFDRAN